MLDWESAGIPQTRHELDAGPILEASERAVTVFDHGILPPWPDEGDGPERVEILTITPWPPGARAPGGPILPLG